MKEEFDALFAEHQKLLGELQAMRAVAKPEQEPVAYCWKSLSTGDLFDLVENKNGDALKEQDEDFPTSNLVLLYTTPPQRTWVGLTDEEFTRIQKETPYTQFMTVSEYALQCQIKHEAKLKEKNT